MQEMERSALIHGCKILSYCGIRQKYRKLQPLKRSLWASLPIHNRRFSHKQNNAPDSTNLAIQVLSTCIIFWSSVWTWSHTVKKNEILAYWLWHHFLQLMNQPAVWSSNPNTGVIGLKTTSLVLYRTNTGYSKQQPDFPIMHPDRDAKHAHKDTCTTPHINGTNQWPGIISTNLTFLGRIAKPTSNTHNATLYQRATDLCWTPYPSSYSNRCLWMIETYHWDAR